MIIVVIVGPPKSGKSILAQLIKDMLKSLGDSVTITDDSPRMSIRPDLRLPQVFKGTTIEIIVKSVAK